MTNGFPFPAIIVPALDGTGMSEICTSSFDGTGMNEICTRQNGLGFDPTGAASIVGSVGGIIQAFASKKIADKAAKVQELAIKAQREQNSRDFAMAQAQAQALAIENDEDRKRLGTYAIAAVLAGVGMIFLVSAIRTAGKKRDAELKGKTR